MTQTVTPLPARPPVLRRRWVRVLLWTTGAVAAVVLALFLWFAAMLSGGWDDLLSPGGPSESDVEVVAAGEQALEELAREPLPVPGVSAVAAQQECQVGEHNWKIDDDFDLSCVATRTTLSSGQVPAFREQALALHERLAADGWTIEHADIPSVLREYWDVRSSSGGAYAPGDLPPAGYVRGELRLEVRWLSAPGRFPYEPSPAGDAAFVAPDGQAVDPRSLVSEDQYAASLTVSTESFRA
jgi:hypothetical protein